MRTLAIILATICCLLCVPDAQAGQLCRLFGSCRGAQAQADSPVQKSDPVQKGERRRFRVFNR